MKNANVLEQFTGLYSLSKTLRLKGDPETFKNTVKTFEKWWKEIEKEEDSPFHKDTKLADAKIKMMAVIDNIHEQFINEVLLGEEFTKIDFSAYLDEFRNNKFRNKVSKDTQRKLRNEIGVCFKKHVSIFLDSIQINVPDKQRIDTPKASLKNLRDNKILDILSVNKDFCPKSMNQCDYDTSIKELKGFWGILDTYNTNRANYYESNKEQSTAIATRIISDLLPTFCSNIVLYEKHSDEYNKMYSCLKRQGVEMKIKNPQTGCLIPIESIDFNVFTIDKFKKTVTQKDIEAYNFERAKINELVNLYNQQFSNTEGFQKLSPFSKLHKQIGCKPSVVSNIIRLEEEWEKDVKQKDKEICKSLETLINQINSNFWTESGACIVENLITELKQDSFEGLYMTDEGVETMLHKYVCAPFEIRESAKKIKSCVKIEKKEQQAQWNTAVELQPLFQHIDKTFEYDRFFKPDIYGEYSHFLSDQDYSISVNIFHLFLYDLETQINAVKPFPYTESFKNNENVTKELTTWLDALLRIFHWVKFFDIKQDDIKGNSLNIRLKNIVDDIFEADWFGWYNAARNFILKKPQDNVKEQKLKLNFNTSSFLKGWSVGYEEQKLGVIIRKEGTYYLSVLKERKLFDTDNKNNPMYPKTDTDKTAQRMIIKQLDWKTLTGKGYKSMYGIKYSEEEKEDQAIERVKILIQKTYLKKYPNLEDVCSSEYKSKEDFQNAVEAILLQYSKCEWCDINWDYLLEKEKAGDVFMFRLHTKDFSPYSKGKKNLHTIYWEDIFSGDSCHRIGASAELFMRDAVAETPDIIHKAGSYILNKRYRNGNIIPNDIYKEIYDYINDKTKHLSLEARKRFDNKEVKYKQVQEKHEIIKDKRFYFDKKYLFHCPITLNAKPKKEINADEADAQINAGLLQMQHPMFLGLDRGEKHLVYYCKIDENGNILACDNYDIINNTNYVQLLEDRAQLRKKEEKSWKQKTQIKDLKKGYISLVVNRIVEDAIITPIKNDTSLTYIVLEKLNKTMKQKRIHIEKQTYQKLESALGNKLSFLVSKDLKDGFASIKKPLQLVPPVRTYDDMDGKDSFGIMQYTRANYTSVTDPLTGWRQSIYIHSGTIEAIKKEILSIFDDICFDGSDYVFKYTDKNTGKQWQLYSGIHGEPLDRFRYDPKTKENKFVNVVEILNVLFKDFDKKKSLKEQLKKGKVQMQRINSNRTAMDDLRFVINIIQQIRNTGNTPVDDNYLQSPVRDEKGRHFDTRKAKDFPELATITNGDANGAYNIARKGLLMYEHRKYCNENHQQSKNLNLYISDKEWDLWLQDREEWKKRLSEFAIKKQAKKSND